MAQARTRPGRQHGGSREGRGGPGTARAGSPYLDILRLPGAVAFSATGMIARMPMSMFGLGTVLLVASVTGRYGVAGLVAAAGSVVYAGLAPQAARLADRLGQGRVLRPQVLLFAAAAAVFVGCAELGAPLWALVLSAMAAWAPIPSPGSMVRTRWSVLLNGSPLLLTAFSLESVIDEMIFVVGPALVTLLATALYPAAGVITAVALCVTGTLLFARQRGTEPPPQPAARRAGARRGPRIAAPGLLTLAPVYCCLGAMFVSIDLSTVAFATERGLRPISGLVLGTYALGSAIGGFWYGSRTWRAPLGRRFAVTLCCTVAGVATFWAQPGIATLFAVMLVAGLAIAPTLIAGASLIERQAPAGRTTEGMTWLSSAISVGVAAGAPVAGRLIDTHGARWGYAFAAACGGAAVTTCLTGLRRLRTEAPQAPLAPQPEAAGLG